MNTVTALTELVEMSREHMQRKTTAQWASTMEIPVAEYLDHDIWRREIDALFLRRPQVLAFSTELAEPGDFRAITLAGVPVLVTRDKDGMVHAFVNACRHRGTQLVADGCGQGNRFVCPYHAWTYDGKGKLLSVYAEKLFGEVDKPERGLTRLACDERAGIIWGMLTPGIAMNIDDWLGDYVQILDELDLTAWHVAERRELAGPSWKIVFDGYLEGYHFDVLHKPSVGKDTKGTMIGDQYGPHQRLVFAREGINTIPEGTVASPGAAIFPVHSIYPNVSIAGGYLDQILFSQVMPGKTPEESITLVTLLSRTPLDSADQIARMAKYADYIFAVLRDEDFAAGIRIQATLKSGGNKTFVIGRNEFPLQHFHTWLRRHRELALPQPGEQPVSL